MTHVITQGMDGFRAVMDGPVILPGDAGFDDSRRVWNAAIDRRPAVIARCATAADVVAAVGFAREHGLDISVRGGAHNPAGTAVCDDGLMLDLSGEHVPAKGSPMSALLCYRLDGAYCRAGEQDTAFSGGRSPRYAAFIIGMGPDDQVLAAERGWVRGFWSALRPLAIDDGDGGGYINGNTDYAGDGVAGAYGAAKYERLARVKAGYDPDNVFHGNANVRPAG